MFVRWALRILSLVMERSLRGSCKLHVDKSGANRVTHFSDRIRVASFLVILGSKPPL